MARVRRADGLYEGTTTRSLPVNEPPTVDHPSHYRLPGGGELLDLIEGMSFCRGNAIKYLFRAGRKDGADELDDLRKAAVYVQREIGRLERGRS